MAPASGRDPRIRHDVGHAGEADTAAHRKGIREGQHRRDREPEQQAPSPAPSRTLQRGVQVDMDGEHRLK